MTHQRSQIGLPNKNLNTSLENITGLTHLCCYMWLFIFWYSNLKHIYHTEFVAICSDSAFVSQDSAWGNDQQRLEVKSGKMTWNAASLQCLIGGCFDCGRFLEWIHQFDHPLVAIPVWCVRWPQNDQLIDTAVLGALEKPWKNQTNKRYTLW